MVTVKIECGCGQHYTFDVEPVNRAMATAIACPACGTDGTAAANEVIAQELAPPPPVRVPATAPGQRLRVQLSGPATRTPSAPDPSPSAPPTISPRARTLGMVDRETAETQARAKISWGDPPNEVIKYLMLQGFTVPEARELVSALFKERLVELRAKGFWKIVAGLGAMCVPVVAWFTLLAIGFLIWKLMAVAVMVGLWGFYQVVTGAILMIAPRMETGEVGA